MELISITPDAEKLIETAGRTSYLSFAAKGEKTERKFVRTLLRKGHYSVLEHATATFRISHVSRAFTHQLIRHRLCSFTQQSQRNVDESHFAYVEPDTILSNRKAHAIFSRSMEEARDAYFKLCELGIEREDARFVLPNATESQITVTANLREWRHIIELRGDPTAQWEIRKTMIEILKVLKNNAPAVFEDFEIDEETFAIRRAPLV